MRVADQRILTRISTSELERRWSAARREMRDRGIDALLVQQTNDWLGGYVKWLTDLPANSGYPRTIVFPADDHMTVIEMGPFGMVRDLGGSDPLHRGVGTLIHTPSFFSCEYTHKYDAELMAAHMAKRGYRTIAFVGKGVLPHAFVTGIEGSLSGVSFVDATSFIDRIKAIKSPEEIALIRRTAEMQDDVFEKVLQTIRPGLRDVDITAAAQYEGQRLGSEQGIFLGGSSPVGIRSSFVPRYMQGRTLRASDHLSLLIENNGPGGFYTEIARTIVLGKASQELKEGFAAVREAQEHTLGLLKPGARAAEVAAAHDAFMIARGLPPERRLYAHSQGYDMVERPLIRSDETMTIEVDMCLAVHPGYETPSVFAVICDNYLIGPEGPGACLHRTPKQIFEC